MKVITAVLIGAGLRGGWVYAAYAQSHPEDLKIVAVAEPDEERRNLIAEVHGIPEERCYQDYRELLEEEKMADCALVCTQDTMHFEPVTKALEKGYHVLCEKTYVSGCFGNCHYGKYGRKIWKDPDDLDHVTAGILPFSPGLKSY